MSSHGLADPGLQIHLGREDLELADQLDLIRGQLDAQRLDQPELGDARRVPGLEQRHLGLAPRHVRLHRLQPRPRAHLLARLRESQVLLRASQLTLRLRGPFL